MEQLTLSQLREQNYNLEGIQIKPYLSLPLKQLMINGMLSICMIEDESTSIIKIDYSLKEFAFEITLVGQYSNLEIPTHNLITIYDELKEHQVIDTILSQIPKTELDFFRSVLHEEIEQKLKLENSIESIVANALNKVVSKLPDDKDWSKLVKEIPKQINKINPDKLKFLSDAILWNNGKLDKTKE